MTVRVCAVGPSLCVATPGISLLRFLYYFSVYVDNNDIAANATFVAPQRQLSFIAFRNVRAGLVWVDELFTARKWREMCAAEGRRVELQVLSGPEGEGARRAYTGMGMHSMTGKETSRTYREVSDKSRYEFWVTNEYVVQSGWDERTALRVVDGRWDELKDE